jgi:guanylate kinase
VTRPQFEAKRAAGDFLEWAEIVGNLYGTSAADTDRLLDAGEDVVLVIDVQGARKVRDKGVVASTIFVMPPSASTLEERLRRRSKDSEEAMRRRIELSRREVTSFEDYDFIVINDELDRAVDGLRSIVLAERARLGRMRTVATAIARTFAGHDA